MQNAYLSYLLDAVKEPQNSFKCLKNIKPILDESGDLIFYAGKASLVVKVLYKGRVCALKCYCNNSTQFKKELKERDELLKGLSLSLVALQTLYFDELLYIDINGDTHNATVALALWYEEGSLQSVAQKAIYYGDRATILRLTNQFISLSLELLASDVAHGDIKPNNIVVDGDRLLLLDWDGAYIPSLRVGEYGELGTRGFRHPLRLNGLVNKRIDDYSILMVVITLLVLESSFLLFERFNDGEFSLYDPEINSLENSQFLEEAYWQFHGNIIEMSLLQLVKSDTLELYTLPFLLSKLYEKRQIKQLVNEAVDSFWDEKSCRYGLSDCDGSMVFPAIFSDITSSYNGLFGVKFGDKWGFVSSRGVALTSFEYDEIFSFSDGFFSFKSDGLYGFIDRDLNVVIAPQFQKANSFREGVAAVCKDDKWGFIDKSGSYVVPSIYDFLSNCRNGKFKARKDSEVYELFIRSCLEI